jgi:hypothetical protein
MASEGQKPRKDDLVKTLTRRIAELPKDDVAALVGGVESGDLDLERLAREARSADEDGPPFGFQRRLRRSRKR